LFSVDFPITIFGSTLEKMKDSYLFFDQSYVHFLVPVRDIAPTALAPLWLSTSSAESYCSIFLILDGPSDAGLQNLFVVAACGVVAVYVRERDTARD